MENKTTEIKKLRGQPLTMAQAFQFLELAEAGVQLPETGFMTYADLGRLCLDQMPQGGFTTSEMKRRLDIMTQLESADGTIELEKAEWEKLEECVKAHRWSMMHRDLVAFEEAVAESKKDAGKRGKDG